MNQAVIGLVAIAAAAGATVPQARASDASSEKPVIMEKFEISESALDLNQDKHVDSLDPKARVIIYDLGNTVPAGDIMACFTCDQLEDTYRPVYRSLLDFAVGVRHEGWTIREERELADFYVVVMSTPSGHLAGVYYAKTKKGEAIQRNSPIELFVADEHFRKIIPESNVFSLDQRIRYHVSTSGVGGAGLMPLELGGAEAQARSPTSGAILSDRTTGSISMLSGPGIASRSGSMVFHEGELFLLSRKTPSFVFVFKAGPDKANSVGIAFPDWFDDEDAPPEGFDRVHVTRSPATH